MCLIPFNTFKIHFKFKVIKLKNIRYRESWKITLHIYTL